MESSRGKKEYDGWFFSQFTCGWVREIRPPRVEVSILARECKLSSPGGLGQMMPTCPLSWIETHLGTSFFFSERNTRSGWRTASIHCDFLPHRDSYFLIKRRTCTSYKKWMHDRYVELAVLATRCVQLRVLPCLLLPLLVRAIWNYKNEISSDYFWHRAHKVLALHRFSFSATNTIVTKIATT